MKRPLALHQMALGLKTSSLLLARYVTLGKYPNFSLLWHLPTLQSCYKIIRYVSIFRSTMTGAESKALVQSRYNLLISTKNDSTYWVNSQLGNINNLFQDTVYITESQSINWFTSMTSNLHCHDTIPLPNMCLLKKFLLFPARVKVLYAMYLKDS